MLGLNPSQVITYPDEIFCVSFHPSRPMLTQHLVYATATSLQIFSNSSLVSYLTIWCYIECSFCWLIRCPGSFLESLSGDSVTVPSKLKVIHMMITWLLQSCATKCYRTSCYCALCCVFMARVRYNFEQFSFMIVIWKQSHTNHAGENFAVNFLI
jgi:hypothetical protein